MKEKEREREKKKKKKKRKREKQKQKKGKRRSFCNSNHNFFFIPLADPPHKTANTRKIVINAKRPLLSLYDRKRTIGRNKLDNWICLFKDKE